MNDFSDLIVKGTTEALKDIVKDVVKSAARYGQREYRKLLIDFQMGFGTFLERNYRRMSRIKTLLNPSTPVSLEATYVAPNLRVDDQVISEKEFLLQLAANRFLVITGIGGSGKSVFLKHLYIRFYQENLGRLPFFVELRNIKPATTLIEHMFEQVSTISDTVVDSELFRHAMKAGKFIFLLDGFDEIETSVRDDLAKQILGLSYEYGDNAIVLTSRPDGPFASWHEFVVAKMEPFNKRQVLSLISKMRYEKAAKTEFSRLVRDSIFESHSNYLSNPLLATLMLLTYDQGAEIPTRMHVFFERAFDVLFYKHDATKQTSFRRKFRTSLAIDDFRSIFATFSTFTYLDHGSSFVHQQALKCANAAIEYNESTEKADAFVSDLCTSVSILIREGDNYNYIHRSMQEFFVAQFLAHRELENWDDIVERIVKERPNDSVVRQLADINRDKFERQFLSARIAEIRRAIEGIDPEKNPAKIFSLFYITFFFRENSVSSWLVGRGPYNPPWYYMTGFIERGSDFRREMRKFDWAKHLSSLGIAFTEEAGGGGFEVESITDQALVGTPMVTYLKEIKSAVISMDDRLRSTSEKQRKLLSTALLKKAGTT